MFELSVAGKYLLPRRRQLSVSIISLISILVIALVVWLIVVFFSVTEGLKNSWITKLTTLTAPVRITPTEAYYRSYYYQVDSISANSGYAPKSIGEKLLADATDPYDASVDEEVPAGWPEPDATLSGGLKDPVKAAFQCVNDIKRIPGLVAHDYEISVGNIRLRVLRENPMATESFLTYPAYLGTFDPTNKNLYKTLLPMSSDDLHNLFTLLPISETQAPVDLQKRLKRFLAHTTVSRLKTPDEGWRLPPNLLPEHAFWNVYAMMRDNHVMKIFIPSHVTPSHESLVRWQGKGHPIVQGELSIQGHQITLTLPGKGPGPVAATTPLILEGGVSFPATLVSSSVAIGFSRRTRNRMLPTLIS